MYKFKIKQHVFDICKVKLGGQPGEYPTALAGTIFYNKHDIVTDPKKGIFDHKKAESLVNFQQVKSDETKNPAIVHIYGSTNDAIESYINFISEISSLPFFIDSSDVNTRIFALEYVDEVGLSDRVIYNSINMSINEQEIDALKNSLVDASIVLAYNAKDTSVKGKVDVISNGGGFTDLGFLDIAKECGISKCLVDTAITTLGAGGGNAVRATFVLKSLYGLPTGCGIHNAVSSWPWLKKTQTKKVRKACDTTTAALEVFCGADFVLYGPIENAEYVFPKVAMSDCFVAEAAQDLGTISIDDHPINTLIG